MRWEVLCKVLWLCTASRFLFLVAKSHLPICSVGFINLGLGFAPFVSIEIYFFLLKIQCYCWAKQLKHNQPQEFLARVIIYKEYTHKEKCYLLLKTARTTFNRWCVFHFLFVFKCKEFF